MMSKPKELGQVFREALHLARATLTEVAAGMGRAYRMVQAYERGERRVTPAASRALAGYLRKRVRELEQAAVALEQAADQEEER